MLLRKKRCPAFTAARNPKRHEGRAKVDSMDRDARRRSGDRSCRANDSLPHVRLPADLPAIRTSAAMCLADLIAFLAIAAR
jgi:hypothetical protein